MARDTAELKDWLGRRLGIDAGIEVLWRQLEEEYYVSEFEEGELDENGVLKAARKKIRDAQELLHPYGESARAPQAASGEKDAGGSSQEEYFEVELGDYEQERARAYEEVLAREAGLTREIAEFRRKLLGEPLLTPDQACELLESPAARLLRPDLFKEWRIPLADHKAELLGYDAGRDELEPDHRATVRVEPPGITKTVRYVNHDATEIGDEAIDAQWYLTGDPLEGSTSISPERRVLRYRDRDGIKAEVRVWPGSVLDVLRRFGARWAGILGWEEEDATLWLLCGRPPRFDPLTARVRYKRGSPLAVELTVHPWVPAETVLENYRKIQGQLLGKENHRLKPRSVDVVRFVENRIREEGARPPWRKLSERWNEEHPAEERFSDFRNFARVYKDTLERVAHYPFYLPRRRALSPATERRRGRRVVEAEAFKDRLVAMLEAHIEEHDDRWPEEE